MARGAPSLRSLLPPHPLGIGPQEILDNAVLVEAGDVLFHLAAAAQYHFGGGPCRAPFGIELREGEGDVFARMALDAVAEFLRISQERKSGTPLNLYPAKRKLLNLLIPAIYFLKISRPGLASVLEF